MRSVFSLWLFFYSPEVINTELFRYWDVLFLRVGILSIKPCVFEKMSEFSKIVEEGYTKNAIISHSNNKKSLKNTINGNNPTIVL